MLFLSFLYWIMCFLCQTFSVGEDKLWIDEVTIPVALIGPVSKVLTTERGDRF